VDPAGPGDQEHGGMIPDGDRLLERAEAAAWRDFYEGCDAGLCRDLGVRVERLPFALVTIAAAFDVLAFNRAILGAGDGDLDSDQLDVILALFRESGLDRGFVQLHPALLSDSTADLLASRGLRLYNRWVKLWRSTEDLPDAGTDLEIVRVGLDRAGEFARVVVSSFGWPGGAEGMIASCVAREGWAHYAAIDSGRLVATAASYVHEDSAWLDFAATLPEARGKGAQSALVARRIADAAEAGCRRVLVETSEPRPDSAAQSHHNVTRLGFRAAYARPNYLWTRS
jgi:GNAT superfamily N-acetyltransferase